MDEPASARLFDAFAHVSDPRSANARHRLFDIFVIALCAVISGAEGWEDMEEYGQAQVEWFKQFLALPHGIPSHDTFRRVLSRLKPDELTQCFVSWTEALRESLDGEEIARLLRVPPLTGAPAPAVGAPFGRVAEPGANRARLSTGVTGSSGGRPRRPACAGRP